MCMGIGATPGTRLKHKVHMKKYTAPERGSAKKKSKLAQSQGVKKTNNRTGPSKFSEIRRSVKFRDFTYDLQEVKENKKAKDPKEHPLLQGVTAKSKISSSLPTKGLKDRTRT